MQLEKDVQHNCDISDAKDSGIYSLCTMVLKLRNQYKWEKGLPPWKEPATPEILDWIEKRENYWDTIAEENFQEISIHGTEYDPFDVSGINNIIKDKGWVYGAGYGRSLKSIFFLAELKEEYCLDQCRVLILDRECAREMASPFAMLQEETIIVRRDALRFFFWDQVQEIRSTSRRALKHALDLYGCWDNEKVNREKFIKQLDFIVDQEIPSFIHHETGEYHEKGIDSKTLKTLVSTFPNSAIELVARGIKDILADTNPSGMLGYIINNQVGSSMAFYVGFLDGLRKVLTPEIYEAYTEFLNNNDWEILEKARGNCRENNLKRAGLLIEACEDLHHHPVDTIQCRIENEVIKPLGL